MSEFRCDQDLLTSGVPDAAVGRYNGGTRRQPAGEDGSLSCASSAAAGADITKGSQVRLTSGCYGGFHGGGLPPSRPGRGVKVSNDQQVVYYRSNGNSVGKLALVFGILSVLFAFTFVGWPLLPITVPLAIILGAVGINRARNSQATNLKTALVGVILGALALWFFASIVTN
jgi:hypothetical protein